MQIKRSQSITLSLILIAIVAIAATISGWQNAPQVKASDGNLSSLPGYQITSISSLGRIEPKSRIRRIFPWGNSQASVITELHVQTGDVVKAGDLLATLDTYDQWSSEVTVAKANVETERAKLAKIRSGEEPEIIDAKRAELEIVRVRMETLRQELGRVKRLERSKAIAVQELEQIQNRFDESTLRIQQLSSELEAMENVRAVDVKLAESELAAAQAELGLKLAFLTSAQIFAPIDGTVLRLNAHAGEQISDEGILELADLTHLQVVAEVFEADIVKLSVGMPAKINVISLSQQFKGFVAEIGQLVGRQNVLSVDPVSDADARVVEVRIDLEPDAIEVLSRHSNARVEVLMSPAGEKGAQLDKAGSP